MYGRAGLIEEETEVVFIPDVNATAHGGTDESNHDTSAQSMATSYLPPDSTPAVIHSSTLGSTGVLTRVARAFEDEPISVDISLTYPEPRSLESGEQAHEERALQHDAERWASLTDRQPPYVHTSHLRRDLHAWMVEEAP